jgi:hypothetical protein
MPNPTPQTIPELWHELDKRLALLELSQANHCKEHASVEKTLADHETRIRSGLTFNAILTGTGGLLALIALVKAFLWP